MNKKEDSPTRLGVIRDKLDEACTDALAACLRQDVGSVLGSDDLAGYALVAWGRDGRPVIYPRLFGPGNPVPAYVLPAYLQIAMYWWIEDGMPDGYDS